MTFQHPTGLSWPFVWVLANIMSTSRKDIRANERFLVVDKGG